MKVNKFQVIVNILWIFKRKREKLRREKGACKVHYIQNNEP